LKTPSLLLHICCAPDATIAHLKLKGEFETTGYFGNSNIQPGQEYLKRLDATKRLAQKQNLRVVYGHYNPQRWLDEMKGLENLPEGGARCRKCIYLNLLETAEKAREMTIESFTTSLSTSPHKDVQWLERAGKACEEKTGVRYIHRIFRKDNGFLASVKLSQKYGLYRQKYCGCLHSIRNGAEKERLK